ncbi:MAG: hypothetical protein M3336_14635, partial [Chloroflexota bacterium]|nr:hypothetical protein [Chloroflexota bacterium]
MREQPNLLGSWQRAVGLLLLAFTTLGGQAGGAHAQSASEISGYGRPIRFSGYDWLAKVSSVLVGPGPNYFSDAQE